MDQLYAKKYYDEEEFQWWCRSRRELILRIMDYFPRSVRILEIGCSGGFLLKSLQEKGFGFVTGIDINGDAVELCRKKGLDAYLRDGKDPGFEGSMFDVIIASDVLEHIDDDSAALVRWHKVLKQGGTLFCFTPAFGFLWSGHDVANQHKRRYKTDELRKKLSSAGFLVARVSYWNFFLFAPTLAVRLIQRLFLSGKSGKPKDQFYSFGGGLINMLLLNLVRLENFLIIRGISFPVGVSCFIAGRKRAG